MSDRHTNILSIAIGRQRIGFAVFDRGDLEFVTGRGLPVVGAPAGVYKQILAYLTDLVHTHQIAFITMPRLTVQQKGSPAVARLYKRFQKFVLMSGLTLVIQDDRNARNAIGTVATADTNGDLAAIYPELRRYLRSRAAWEKRYYKHIFKAVGSGLAWRRTSILKRRPNGRRER